MPRAETIAAGKQYLGKYVATVSFHNKRVVACGDTRSQARTAAAREGHSHPVIVYIPDTKSVNNLRCR